MDADFIFDRDQERASLAMRLSSRRRLLIHGPAGVGKTLLITAALKDFPDFLYSPDSSTINVVFRNIASRLCERRAPHVLRSFGRAGADAIKGKSASNLKGILRDALHEGSFCNVFRSAA
jgi:GTPase SAR1 family protein